MAQGGVGILVNNNAAKSLSKVEPRSNRILIIPFTGNPKTTVIVTYSPTNVATDKDIQQYYESLRRAIKSVPAHNFLIMHTATNRNGKLLHELAVEKHLIIGNTSFQKGLGKLWTHISHGGYKSQIDNIIIRENWRNSLLNAESYNSFSSIGSDHRIMSVRIRLSL